MGYKYDITKSARDFILENEEIIKQGLIDGVENFSEFDNENYDYLDEAIREEEFYFDLSDAVVVIETSDNTEEDTGLWEGLQPEEALIRKAQYTAQNDLYEKVEEIYKTLKTEYDYDLNEEETNKKETADKVFNFWKETFSVKPLKKGSEEEKNALNYWLIESKEVGFRGGYPLGSSYIDSRCGSGYDNNSQQADYIDLDKKTAKLCPHLAGKYRRDVEEYFKKTFNKVTSKIERIEINKLKEADEDELESLKRYLNSNGWNWTTRKLNKEGF